MYEEEVNNYRDYLIRKRFREESVKTYTRTLSQLIAIIQKNPRKLNRNDIKKWESHCLKYHNNTLTPKYCAINKYLTYLVDEEYLDETTAKKLKLSPPQMKKSIVQALSRDDIQKLFKVAKRRCYRDYTIFITSYCGMLRRGEVLNLNLMDINLTNNQIAILDSKGGKDDIIQISQECSDAIERYINQFREKPKKDNNQSLFLNNGRKLSKNKLQDIFKEYKMILGWDNLDFYPHIMRHTGITHYAEVEKDIAILQRQTRHKDIETLITTYIHKTEGELKEAYDKAFNDYKEKPKKPTPDIPPNKPIDGEVTPPQQITPPILQQSSKQQLKNQLVQRLARGEITQDVYLIALKELDETIDNNQNYIS